MRETVERLRRKCLGAPRLAAALLAMLLLAACLVALAGTVQTITVTDLGGASRTLLPAGPQPQVMRVAGLASSKNDRVTLTRHEDNSASIIVYPAFPVSVTADGRTFNAEMVEGTVADLLAEADVVLQGEDYVEPALDTPLEEGLCAQVYRVGYAEEVRREALDAETVAAYKATLPEGTVFVDSYNGQYDVAYRDTLVNGQVQSSEIVEMVPVIQPRPQDSYTIETGVPCSRITGYDDVQFGADGLPTEYTRLWEGAVCTAYSSSGGMGSSGLGLYCGTVAVNPNIIPYGTRMYITSADGQFVYGFAIATDTGTAMMEGYVDVDLYFETNAECYAFGKRALNVYFLD